MKYLLSFLIVINLSLFSFSQTYNYEFSVSEITDFGTAKESMEKIRDILGIVNIKFNDDSDQFIIHTKNNFDIIEMIDKLRGNGINIVGSITKNEEE